MAKFAAKDSNKNITLSPHGTGKVVVGTGATDATVQSDGNHNLVLQTGNSTTGSISITDGADGDIDIAANGTGAINTTKNVNLDGGASPSDVRLRFEEHKSSHGFSGGYIHYDGTNNKLILGRHNTSDSDVANDLDVLTIDRATGDIAFKQDDGSTSKVIFDAGTGSLSIDNIKIDNNAITSTNSNGDIDLTPNGTGEVNISKVDIDSGTIDGTTIATSDVTVGAGKTLDVSAGTLTTSSAQKDAIVAGASTIDVSSSTFTTSTAQKDAIVDGSTAISRSGNNLTFAGTVANTGNNTITSGDLRFATASKGIDFSGIGTAAEILTEYEEGTVTNPLVIGSTNITTNASEYIRIGDMVFVHVSFDVTTATTGAIKIDLPFPKRSGYGLWYPITFYQGAWGNYSLQFSTNVANLYNSSLNATISNSGSTRLIMETFFFYVI